MMRKFGMILGLAGMVALVGACSDDSGTTPPKDDGGTIRLDQGGGGNEGGVPTPDTGGGGSDQTCTEVLQCAANCSDQNCIANCVAKGSADAQTKFNALATCLNGAQTGACASDCTNPQSSACSACLQGSTSGNGFCTKSCTNSGGLCPNVPANTQAFCILSDGQGGNFCAFLCEAQGQKWDCPTGLTCSTTDNPPGSGQFSCEP